MEVRNVKCMHIKVDGKIVAELTDSCNGPCVDLNGTYIHPKKVVFEVTYDEWNGESFEQEIMEIN